MPDKLNPVPDNSPTKLKTKQYKAPGWPRRVFGFAFIVGFIAGLGTDLGDEFTSGLRHVSAQDFLTGSAALGAAFAAVNIAVLALIAVWFDDTYQLVLERRGGWAAAMGPFRVISTVSVITTLSAIVGLFVLGVQPVWPRALILGITGGLLSWSLIGTLQVITLLFDHGKARSQLIKKIREERQEMGLPPEYLSR